MAVYKRGGVWWFNFVFRGERFQESTKQGSKRVAQQIEAARKTELAKGEVGIRDRKPVPTLAEFAPRFSEAVKLQCADKPRTVEFYEAKLRLLTANVDLAAMRLDQIDEECIESYKQVRSKTTSRRGKTLSVGSINRELATLRKLLRLAHNWKLLSRVPKVELLRGEHAREFVLTHAQELEYLQAAPQLLANVAIVLVDTGLRLGELLSLDWRQVRLQPANGAKFGFLTVLSAKAKNGRSRNVPLSERAIHVLQGLSPKPCGLVFLRADGQPYPQSHLDQQHARVRAGLGLSSGFVLHSLRHTFGTRLGEAGADAFTIMKLMGHSTVTVSQRYVHPSPESVELAYERLTVLNRKGSATVSATVESSFTSSAS